MDGRETNCTEIRRSPSDGTKNIVNISLVAIDFSCTATRKERERYENNDTLGVNGQGPKPGAMKKTADFPQAVNKLLAPNKQLVNPNPQIPAHLRFRQRPTEEKGKSGTAMETLGLETFVSIFCLPFNLVDASRMATMARISHVLWR